MDSYIGGKGEGEIKSPGFFILRKWMENSVI